MATILHDVGLVYKRTDRSPSGHEKRSIEYTEKILRKYHFDRKTKKFILDCIKATDARVTPKDINAKIIRTSDALAQFFFCSFLAKVYFYKNWPVHFNWLSKKVENNFYKICFIDERKLVKPIYRYFKNIIILYSKNKNSRDICYFQAESRIVLDFLNKFVRIINKELYKEGK